MAAHTRVLNVTRNFRMKFRQAEKAIENCACTWLDYGVTVRDLTLAESIKARNEQASRREPLARAELPNLTFQHPGAAQERQLAFQAQRFAFEAQ